MVSDLLKTKLPLGEGPQALRDIGQSLTLIDNFWTNQGCSVELPSSTNQSDFFNDGWGSQWPDYCGSLFVLLDNGDVYGAFNKSAGTPTWYLLYSNATAGSPDGMSTAKNGFRMKKLANDKIVVSAGSITHGTVVINRTSAKVLILATGSEWIDGISREAADAWVHVYIDVNGNMKLHDHLPNNSANIVSSFVMEARIDQLGWDGTVANGGYNETSLVYDDGLGGSPSGEGNLLPGMLVGIFEDSTYETGAGKGDGVAGTIQDVSFALIQSVDTVTNTLTLISDHRIAMSNDDYLVVIENGDPVYRQEGSNVWRWIGAIYNDSGFNLNDDRQNHRSLYELNEVSDYSTTSATFIPVDSTKLAFPIVTMGGDIEVHFHGSIAATSGGASDTTFYFDIEVDGQLWGGDDGIIAFRDNNFTKPVSFTRPLHGLVAGTHKIKLMWKGWYCCATFTLYSGGGTLYNDIHPSFSIREVN